MKEKMLTSDFVKQVYDVIAERQVRAIDTDCLLMNGIEYTITDNLSGDHVSYVLSKYPNVLIYTRDKIQRIAIYPRAVDPVNNE